MQHLTLEQLKQLKREVLNEINRRKPIDGVELTIKTLLPVIGQLMGRVRTSDIISAYATAKRTNPELIHCSKLTPQLCEAAMRNLGYEQLDGLWQIGENRSTKDLRLV